MFLPFNLLIEKRVSTTAVESCPLNYKSGETAEIYGKLVRTWTMENGIYDDTYEFSANEFVGDSESCPVVNYSTTAVPGFDYGGVISNSDAWTLPLSRDDVRAHLDGLAPEWSDWSVLWSFTGEGESVFGLLEVGLEEDAGEQLVSEASPVGFDLGVISGSREAAEFRFTLRVPLACTVVYRLGALEIDGGVDYIWADETTLIVSTTPQTLSIDQEDGKIKRLRLVRIIAHPWTA